MKKENKKILKKENKIKEDSKKELKKENLIINNSLIKNLSRLNFFLSKKDESLTLKRNEIIPLRNLEKELPERIEQPEEKQTKYLSLVEENNSKYSIKNNSNQNFLEKRDFNLVYSSKEKMEKNKEGLNNISYSISEELKYVKKQDSLNYNINQKLNFEDFGKEKKKTVENIFEKVLNNYK